MVRSIAPYLLSVGGKDTSMDPDGKTVIVDGSVREGGYLSNRLWLQAYFDFKSPIRLLEN
jgi:hypothetical protein